MREARKENYVIIMTLIMMKMQLIMMFLLVHQLVSSGQARQHNENRAFTYLNEGL